jgi:hypothetical protein
MWVIFVCGAVSATGGIVVVQSRTLIEKIPGIGTGIFFVNLQILCCPFRGKIANCPSQTVVLSVTGNGADPDPVGPDLFGRILIRTFGTGS